MLTVCPTKPNWEPGNGRRLVTASLGASARTLVQSNANRILESTPLRCVVCSSVDDLPVVVEALFGEFVLP